MTSPSRRKSSAVADALRLRLRGRKGPATEKDRPPLSVLPGRRIRILKGQLDLDGNEHGKETDDAA